MSSGVLRSIAVFAPIVFATSSATAFPSGVTGYSGDPAHGGVFCSACHMGGAIPSVRIVDSLDPSAEDTVLAPLETRVFRVRVEGGAGIACGFDVSATGGELLPGPGARNGDPILLEDPAEVTHSSPRAFTGGACEWEFSWTAPEATGAHTFYAAGNSTNLNGSFVGDAAATDQHPVAVVPEPAGTLSVALWTVLLGRGLRTCTRRRPSTPRRAAGPRCD